MLSRLKLTCPACKSNRVDRTPVVDDRVARFGFVQCLECGHIDTTSSFIRGVAIKTSLLLHPVIARSRREYQVQEVGFTELEYFRDPVTIGAQGE